MFAYLPDVLSYLAFGILMAECLWYVNALMSPNKTQTRKEPASGLLQRALLRPKSHVGRGRKGWA